MKFAACLVFAILASFLMMGDAYPQGGVSGLSDLEKAAGRVLIHTSGIEKGHQHTANCFGFGQGGQTTAATTTTTAASK